MNQETTDSSQAMVPTTSWTPPSVEQLASMLPGYEVSEHVGPGSMGAVYKGRHLETDRMVAIKLFPVESGEDAAFVERFISEAQALAQIQHPGVAPVLECGRLSDGQLFLVWEFVEGKDLHRILQGSGISVERVLEILPQLCASVQHVHDHGVLHRNIRPSNIIMRADGRPILTDFALVSPLLEDASHDTHKHLSIGAPDYIAPELLDGAGDHRADVFSLGVLLYEMLTGHVPRGRYEKPSKEIPTLDVRLDAVVDRAIQFDVSRRYSSAHDLQVAIQQIKETPAERRSPDVAVVPGIGKETEAVAASTTLLVKPLSPPQPASMAPPPPAVTQNWEEVHGVLPWWKSKTAIIAAAAAVIVLMAGGMWYRWLQTPEIALREATVEFRDGRRLGDKKTVIASTIGGRLNLKELNERLPEGLTFESNTSSDGTTHYRLAGEPTETEHVPVDLALVAESEGYRSVPVTFHLLVTKTHLNWVLPANLTLATGEPVKADTRVASGVDSLDSQEWSPPCPGLSVDDTETNTTGNLVLAGSPRISGTFQVRVKATSRGGDSEEKTFTVVVKAAESVVLASTTTEDKKMAIAAVDSAKLPSATPDKPASTPVATPTPPSTTGAPVTAANAAPPASSAPMPVAAPGSMPAAAATTPSVPAVAMPLSTTPTPAPPSASVPVAPAVATRIGNSFQEVRGPFGTHTISVTEKDWIDGKVLDQKAGRTLVLKAEDPKLEVEAPDPLAFTVTNPYTSKPEPWPEAEWKDGAVRQWGPFTYHLPTPAPRFEIKVASYEGRRTIQSPYKGGGTLTLSWVELAKGGETKDKKGRPMKLPTITDPELTAKVTDRTQRSYVNPYTGERETWKGSTQDFKEGAKVTWQSGFTFVLGSIPAEPKPEPKVEPAKPETKKAEVAVVQPPPMPKETPKSAPPLPPAVKPVKQKPPGKENFSTQRGFIMQWDPIAGYWICKDRHLANSSSLAQTLSELTKECVGKNYIPQNFKFVSEPDSNGILWLKAVSK
jgi:hypothetical protein